MNIRRFILAVLAAAIPAGAAAAEQPLLLGVLEQRGCGYKDAGSQNVRVLFAYTGGKWEPLDSMAAAEPHDYSNITWTAAFDGRDFGRLKTVDPGFGLADYNYYDDPESNREYMLHRYPADRLLALAPGATPPRIEDKAGNFTGKCDGHVSLRPVVVVSQPNFRDPAKWKPFRPSAAHKETLFDHVAGRIRAPDKNTGPERRINRCSSDPEVSAVAVENIVLNKSYRNNAGQALISIGLAGPRFECPIVQGPQPLWFLAGEEGIRHIGEALALVDAGDYDGDGAADVLFRFRWLDFGGYKLLYGGLGKEADFSWSTAW